MAKVERQIGAAVYEYQSADSRRQEAVEDRESVNRDVETQAQGRRPRDRDFDAGAGPGGDGNEGCDRNDDGDWRQRVRPLPHATIVSACSSGVHGLSRKNSGSSPSMSP